MHPFERLERFSEQNGIGFKVSKNKKGWEVLLFGGNFRNVKALTLEQAVDGAIHGQESGSKLPAVEGSGTTKVQRGIL